MTGGCDSFVHIHQHYPYGFTDTFSTVTVIITHVSEESTPLPRASPGISANSHEMLLLHLSQHPHRPRNGRPPSPSPLSHFALGNDRETLFPPHLLSLSLSPRRSAGAFLRLEPPYPSGRARSCRGSAQVRWRLTKLRACGSLKQITLRKLLVSNS